ncbi:unnamed protein product [Arctia plantaginis]|uniref:Carbonic anhydrase n=1 Tax=Arctia plantaginis TaxID=874455 RepID=A0A8S0ZQQ2_ARCPL|nr:unnamed protein product [Arctia plantaginis]
MFGTLCGRVKIANSEIISTPETLTLGYQPLWSYDEESKWPGYRCKIGGRRQSPIDIKTKNVIEDFNKLYIKNGPLVFKGYDGVLVTGINNGHTIQFSTEGEEAMHPQLRGGPLDSTYRLEQLHFHWMSEHAINGVKYPMEIHFVHVRSDLTVFDALSRKDGLAIVAVFCKVESNLDDPPEQTKQLMEYIPRLKNTGDRISGVFLDMRYLIRQVESNLDDPPEQTKQLMEYIPRLKNTGDRISGVFLDMRKWLSPDRVSYYTYSGSLTSPKCNEAVTWIIFTAPLSISETQYQSISNAGYGGRNSRTLQNLSRHVVYCPPKTKIRIPQFITFFEDFFKTVKILFKNITTSLVTGLAGHYSSRDNIL